MGIGQVQGRFSVDRRSPGMLLYGTLSLFRTNIAGCYAGCGAVTQHLQALWRQGESKFLPCFSQLEHNVLSQKFFHGLQKGQIYHVLHKN